MASLPTSIPPSTPSIPILPPTETPSSPPPPPPPPPPTSTPSSPTSAPSTPTPPPTTPTTPSSSPPSSATSSTSSSTSSSSLPPSTTSAIIPPSTSSSPATSAPPTPTTQSPSSITSVFTSTDTGGGIVTVTSVVSAPPIPSRSVAPSEAAVTTSKTFFHNTGAVAGVFTVVGLIALAIFVALLTNAIRRRRAKRFDREIAEAAREAAEAHAPVFDDDDPEAGYGGAYDSGGKGAGYSDVSSHGTYGQPPMSLNHHGHETYGMSEFQPYETYAAGGAAAGAAGVGASALARARSQREVDGYAPGLGESQTPYPAFAAPGGMQPRDVYQNVAPHDGRPRGPGSPEFDLLEAAGMGAGAGAVGAAGITRGPSHHDLSRNRSMGARDGFYNVPVLAPIPSRGMGPGPGEYVSPPSESYASHYQPGFRGDAGLQPEMQGGAGVTRSGSGGDAAYGGYTSSHGHGSAGSGGGVSPMANPYSANEMSPRSRDESGYGGMLDDGSDAEEEEHEGRRVLKVANE